MADQTNQPAVQETPEALLQAAKAEAEQIVQAAKAQAAEIAGAAKRPARKGKDQDGEELVDYTAPMLPWKNDQTIFAAVNGETIRIRRGENVKIKRKFLEVLQNAQAQEMRAYSYMKAAKQAGEKASAAM